MSNATTQTQAETIFPTAEEEVKSLRAAYVLADNGWLEAAFQNDPALSKYGSAENLRQAIAENPENVELLYYPGLVAMAAHEKANELYKQAQAQGDTPEALANYAYARRLSEAAKTICGMDIHPGATIAKNFFADHCTGVVIGETAVIGNIDKITGELTSDDPSFLLHGVTLGGGATKRKDGGRHPALGKGVVIGSNANVYGGCEIGDYVFIKTNATIIDSNFAHCDGKNTKDNPKIQTSVGANAQVTGSQIGKAVQIYANSTIFKSEIGEGAKIHSDAKVSGSEIGKGAIISADAKVTNCNIGEGAIIGVGVELNGVTVPPYAEIQEIKQPKLVIYSPEHQGRVTARGKEVTPKEGAENAEKALQAPVFATLDEIAAVPNWTDKLAAYAAEKAKFEGATLR
jgi:serine O-acetyltransferase